MLRRRIMRKVQPRHHLGKERRLDAADRDETAIGAGVAGVERRAAIQQIGLSARLPLAGLRIETEQVAERHDAIGHRGVDNLSLAGAAGMQQRRLHPKGQHHRAAGIIRR